MKRIQSCLVLLRLRACARGPTLTSTQFVAGAIAAEVVTLAEPPAVPLIEVFPVLALTRATYAVAAVAANVRSVVSAARPVHIFRGHVVAAAFALSAHASTVTTEKSKKLL